MQLWDAGNKRSSGAGVLARQTEIRVRRTPFRSGNGILHGGRGVVW
jgi:hypothetical protein